MNESRIHTNNVKRRLLTAKGELPVWVMIEPLVRNEFPDLRPDHINNVLNCRSSNEKITLFLESQVSRFKNS